MDWPNTSMKIKMTHKYVNPFEEPPKEEREREKEGCWGRGGSSNQLLESQKPGESH